MVDKWVDGKNKMSYLGGRIGKQNLCSTITLSGGWIGGWVGTNADLRDCLTQS